MKISELFYLHQGNGFELYNMNSSSNSNVSFVSRTAQGNGVVALVDEMEGVVPYPAGYITVALGGSVLSSFVQRKPFYTSFHIMVLEPKIEMTLQEKLFYCMCIQSNAYRYSYGRQANKTLKDIELPDLIPTYVNKTRIIPIHTVRKKEDCPMNTSLWKEFRLIDLFNVERGTRLTKENRLIGNVPLITAGFQNEGVSEYIYSETNKLYNDKITIDMFGNAFYRSYNFYCDDNILVLDNKISMNRYVKLFIATIIQLDSYRFSYGRQYRQKDCKNHVVNLPAKEDGTIDSFYMESYIKSLPYGDRI